ncbi:hypothetical protein [Streptomyces acidiscabies]|uniref:Uncharacterized protein n=1 Tax=Streptomyces acidiscabies TaxID=42234 RepID=A0AAP6EG19_9ACTN|nr:hypothetical protein [Streptomyces acidiscabies]MBP5937979.1 hypothetical protein [Streptomyces sp. LBUM 1476]MBZ3908982.1 hypothetical protein [Streptomyces acidiscabies]MDX2961518.1 hypothetical protein [Streptomyces acidiscabies]MDX3016614.1 hypothetical protein [Streptomyces acidiscabies]MDX3788481.1 hypothetical protein [Streptomyces acidiscabies]
MKGNGRDAAGCLLAVGGAGAGLALWSVDVRGRFYRFEAMSDWSVLYAELPLAVLGGTAAGLLLWATLLRRRKP